jgi:transcriptional regulator with XRE-family HTH domain
MAKGIVGHFTEFVGRRIKNGRKAAKMSPEDLAKRIGVSPLVLDHMERGYCHVNLEQMMQLARHLSLSLEELLGIPHHEENEILEFLNKRILAMSEEELRAWQQNVQPLAEDGRRIYILDIDLDAE